VVSNPFEKILVKMGPFPQLGMKIKDIENAPSSTSTHQKGDLSQNQQRVCKISLLHQEEIKRRPAMYSNSNCWFKGQ